MGSGTFVGLAGNAEHCNVIQHRDKCCDACGWRSAGSYVEKGNRLLAQGKVEEARLNYRRAIQKDTNFGEAYYRLGLALIRLERPREALPPLEQAARLLPTRRDIKTSLADLSLAALLAGNNHPALHDRI